MFSKILVAVDGTATSNRGLATAVGLAKEQGATLYIVHVIDELVMAPLMDGTAAGAAEYIEAMLDSLRKNGRKIVANAEATASKSVPSVNAEMVASAGQTVASAILEYAKRVRADLIVLGRTVVGASAAW